VEEYRDRVLQMACDTLTAAAVNAASSLAEIADDPKIQDRDRVAPAKVLWESLLRKMELTGLDRRIAALEELVGGKSP
jgi:hypothetical protein